MTVASIIRIVDGIKPNAFSPEVKTMWLNEVEGKVQTDVFLWATEEVITYDYAVDADTELLVRPPHDKIYAEYLAAKIDYANGEYDKYTNTMQMFNAFWDEFVAWFATRYRPADIKDTYLARRRLSSESSECPCGLDNITLEEFRLLVALATADANSAAASAESSAESAALSRAAADAVITALTGMGSSDIDISGMLEHGSDLRAELDALKAQFDAILTAIEEVA